MPFGTKRGRRGEAIDFNRIYEELHAPALAAAGLEVFRADREVRAGDILPDMFQELLLADLVLADLTIDNPNVWYELGVRHALKARGVVVACGGHVTTAFDIYTSRKLRYGLKDGQPDPATLASDRLALTTMATATMQSWHGRKISPVYYHLPNLAEPDWRSLRVGDVQEYWERHEAWAERIEMARASENIGDLLVLADEAPVAALRADAWIEAGSALRRAGHFQFALEQLERGLAVDRHHLTGLREKGICLQRLARVRAQEYSIDRARRHYDMMLRRFPHDAETWALRGRVEKDAWTRCWEDFADDAKRAAATSAKGQLRAAIDYYQKGFLCDSRHYFSGINALTLMSLYSHLTADRRYDADLTMYAGAVQFAARHANDLKNAFYAKATVGDIAVLVGTPEQVEHCYREAIADPTADRFGIDSCLQQLKMLQRLEFAPQRVEAGVATLEDAQPLFHAPAPQWVPRKVFLFSGHRVDSPTRKVPRFPNEPTVIAKAGQAIRAALKELDAGKDDLALTQGASGGDLLFTEACLDAGVRVQWLQPLLEPDFIRESVASSGEDWRQRYHAIRSLTLPIRSAPDALGQPPPTTDPATVFERCNRWLLYTAISYGTTKTQFICLWNGEEGDGKGGTKHMLDEVSGRSGNIRIIHTQSLK